ncbi:hypothetical protein N656DRAFT_132284 [Canariomyces notabilis]|uniref:Uncharacterized protein n=1 Tax=Canariomyces notabilis TaxID=2074819 RepID=A0AAN6TCN9_9PEZI|nr:hypothetical protein N656DRAFT_132284 [Canariomyces arenarius]
MVAYLGSEQADEMGIFILWTLPSRQSLRCGGILAWWYKTAFRLSRVGVMWATGDGRHCLPRSCAVCRAAWSKDKPTCVSHCRLGSCMLSITLATWKSWVLSGQVLLMVDTDDASPRRSQVHRRLRKSFQGLSRGRIRGGKVGRPWQARGFAWKEITIQGETVVATFESWKVSVSVPVGYQPPGSNAASLSIRP